MGKKKRNYPPDSYIRLWEAYRALSYSGDPLFFKSKRFPHLERYVLERACPKKSRSGRQVFYEVEGRGRDSITREELLRLARLPANFELPPFPEVPSAEEVQELIDRRISSLGLEEMSKPKRIRAYFKALKKLPYPRVICDAILRASNFYDAKGTFLASRYHEIIEEKKRKYEIIEEILNRKE